MQRPVNPKVVYHADWGSTAEKRWCAKAMLGTGGRYTASAPEPVGPPGSLMGQLRTKAGDAGCAFAGFDFQIGVPAFYARRAKISSFRDLLPKLGHDEWSEFYAVCDEPEQVSLDRPFYPNRPTKGRRQEDLFRRLGADSMDPLLRRCDGGGNGRKKACCLFWTLGRNQVGKAAIGGWRDVLAPALRGIDLWPFDGRLRPLLVPGNVVVAETYPAECYGWFGEPPDSKGDQNERKRFGASLLRWAHDKGVALDGELRKQIEDGFPQGKDDAFDAVVGLFGMLQVCLGQRATGEPDNREVREIEGWILGREP